MALEDIDEQDSDEETDHDGGGGPDEDVDDARARFESAQKHQDRQFDDSQGWIIEELIGKVPLRWMSIRSSLEWIKILTINPCFRS